MPGVPAAWLSGEGCHASREGKRYNEGTNGKLLTCIHRKRLVEIPVEEVCWVSIRFS